MKLEAKHVVVTGAAQGIGAEIARRLASDGANVVLADLQIDSASRVAEEITRRGDSAVALYADVTDRSSVRELLAAAVSHFGPLDVMFNNAGFNKPEPFLDISEKTWHSILEVNSLGVLIGTQEAAKIMIDQGSGGKIINTASIAGRQGYPDFVPYSASKFAVIAITQGAARALAGDNIRVNAFAPGVVDTPLWDRLDKDLMSIGASERPGQAMEEFSEGILVGRPAQPKDIAGTAAFLASSDSDYMTGQVVMIDGGMVLV